MRLAWVVAGFFALVALLAVGLRLNPREVPSPLIGKPAPAFELPLLHAPAKTFSRQEMLGKVWVLNVWASWCPPCLVEHPVVTALAQSGIAPVVGLNYKDARKDALPWLQRHGDPYQLSVFDADGRIGIEYGVYGVPETYVIDRGGLIRYKHIGPLTPEIARDKLAPLIKTLGRAG
jgi:cytochrome c biogenesis protein CcmG, thiol:disulfide interchange protein DsbE